MIRMAFRRLVPSALGAAVVLAFAATASAQTGVVRGKVVDAQGAPVDGAKVTISAKSVKNAREVKTNKKGEFVQVGLFPGDYTITVEKDQLKATQDAKVSVGDNPPIDIKLAPAAGGNAEAGGQGRRPPEGLRGGRRAQQGRQVRRVDCEVQRSRGTAAELLRLLLQHRLREHAEEGLGGGRSGVQEGDRAEGGALPRLERPGQRLQHPEQDRPCARGQRQGVDVRRRRGRRQPAAAWTPAAYITKGLSSGTRKSSPRRRRSSTRRRRPTRNSVKPGICWARPTSTSGDFAGAVAAFEGYLQARADRRARRRSEEEHRAAAAAAQEVAVNAAPRRRLSELPTIAEVVALNLTAVRRRLEQAARTAGRDPASIRLVAVSKTFPHEAVRAAAACRPARFRREPRPGGATEDSCNGRSTTQVASHRPPAIEQGEKGRRRLRPDSFD